MHKTLSVAIPVYNFATYLPETLDSIVTQARAGDIEILILDGASSDETPALIKKYQRYFKNIKYVRLSERGGIDRDMARAVTHSSGDYCWLFSGDDLMLPGALEKALEYIETRFDLYLTRHLEWVDDRSEWVEWPTLNVTCEPVFELSNDAERHEYFSRAENTEAFFGFIGGIIVKKSKWDSIPINEEFIGSCWAHVARLFELMPNGLSVKVLSEPYLKRRPDNDSFGSSSIISRFRLTIDGFIKITDHFFGPTSFEAKQVRRVLRNEYHPLNMWLGKFLCLIDPEREDIALMDRLLAALYGDKSWDAWKVRFHYARVTPQRFRKWQPDLSAKFDAIKAAK
jgi:abequosyltransferase